MDARRSQFDLGIVDAYILAEGSNVVVLELPYSTEFGRESREKKVCEWGPKIWKI